MRVFSNNPEKRGTEISDGVTLMMNVSFTGDAIAHLNSPKSEIDLKEWIWHEEYVNGTMYCIITNRKEIKE